MKGTVVKSTGNLYTVRTDEAGVVVECKVKGSFRLKGIRSTNPVAVGDRVSVEPSGDGMGYITAIDDRRNYIIRKASNLSKQSHILAANLDLVLLLATPSMPETSTTFIDRVLAGAEAYGVPVVIVFNKSDLYTPTDRHRVDELRAVYTAIGYPCLEISCHTHSGTEELFALLAGKVTLLAGHSGVGKSTLLNLLVPSANMRTSAISCTHGTGMHTTTFSEWFALPGGGALIDVPGIKGFGTFDFERAEVAHYFREIFTTSSACRFADCTHTHEPGCAVLTSITSGTIAESRYKSYLSILSDEADNKYREGY